MTGGQTAIEGSFANFNAIEIHQADVRIANSLIEYRRIGITQFILSGWPELQAVTNFGKEVLPLVREMEMSAGPIGAARVGA